MTETMPKRYRLETVTAGVSDGQVRIPRAGAEWLDVVVGETVGVAPHSPTAVRVGQRTPRALSERPVERDYSRGGPYPRIRLQAATCAYLDVSDGDTVTVREHDRDGELLVEVER